MSKQLFADFPGQSKEEWIEQVVKERKGRSYAELNHEWSEDFEMEAFYHPDDDPQTLEPIGKATEGSGWNIAEQIDLTQADNEEKILNDALGSNVDSLFLTIDEDGLHALSAVEETIRSREIDLHCSVQDAALGRSLHEQFGTTNQMSITTEESKEDDLVIWKELQNGHDDSFIQYRHETDEQEDPVKSLTALLSGWMTLLEKFPADKREEFTNKTHMLIHSGPYYLAEIAKIRALKILWLNLMESESLPISYPAITVLVPRSLYGDDPQINHIKATVSAMSAVLGGADGVLVSSIHAGEEKPTPFSHRMARNILHILKLESFFDAVHDPVAGSFYIDQLTAKLAKQCWNKL